jgi:hypothetical protein
VGLTVDNRNHPTFVLSKLEMGMLIYKHENECGNYPDSFSNTNVGILSFKENMDMKIDICVS